MLLLRATAVDLSGNASAPASLALTVTALPEVTFGPSLIMDAGETKSLALQLSSPAPSGGLRVDFASDAAMVTTTPFVTIAEGQTDATISVSGVAGGTAFINALIQGVQRGSATAVIQGGVVTGIVRDPQLTPVADAKITLTEGYSTFTAETDSSGRFRIQGVFGPFVSIKVLKDVDADDPAARLRIGVMNRANGFVNVDVVLVAAGIIHGPVFLADGSTPAADGVRVDLMEGNGSTPISTTFTSNGSYEFPLVGLGKYTIEASDSNGNRGRATAEIASSGQDATVPIAFLGRGSVTVAVKDGAGNPVYGAVVTVYGYSIFGGTPPITGTAVDGTFTVGDLFLGTFTVQARDPLTNQAASLTGELTAAAPNATRVLTLSSFAGLQGTVYRADGVTTVSGATVSAFGISTLTDTQGHYAMSFLPLGTVAVSVREPASRGIGQGAVTLDQQGQTKTVDVTLFAQGTLVVTVQTANHAPVPNVRGPNRRRRRDRQRQSVRHDRRRRHRRRRPRHRRAVLGAGDCRDPEGHGRRHADGERAEGRAGAARADGQHHRHGEGAERRAGDRRHGVERWGIRELHGADRAGRHVQGGQPELRRLHVDGLRLGRPCRAPG